MNAYTFLAIHNTVLCAMTAAAVYVTESLWALLPLVFIGTTIRKEGAK